MKDYTRKQIVHALRQAADAIEAGANSHPCIGFTSFTVDGFEESGTVDGCESRARWAVQPDDEYDHDVRETSWGIYVAVETADYEEIECDMYGLTPRECGHDFDRWSSVWLRDAWPSITEVAPWPLK